jgi:3-hydroxybutyryl-CoA dehydratase
MNLRIGDTGSLTRTVTNEDIHAFADLSGDHNPIHLDESYAATTRFGKRIAHGMFGASLISAVIGNELPGTGSIYLSQTLKFLAPVYLGETVTARVTVTRIRDDKHIVTLECVCENQRGEALIKGEAVVMVED